MRTVPFSCEVLLTTLLRPVTYGPGSIRWGQPHVCDASLVAQTIASPIASWMSVGFGAVATGASIYNAFQLHQQGQMIEGIAAGLADLHSDVREISSKLDRLDRKLDQISLSLNVLHYKMDHVITSIKDLTQLSRDNLQFTKKIASVQALEFFVDSALKNFEKMVDGGGLTHQRLRGLAADIETGLSQISQAKTGADLPLPHWMIDQAEAIFSFFRIFNLFLVESHNALSKYDPTEMRQHLFIERASIHWNRTGTAQDASWSGLIELQEQYRKAEKKEHHRLRWLLALLWEIKQANHQLQTSTFLSSNATLYLPEPKRLVEQMSNPRT